MSMGPSAAAAQTGAAARTVRLCGAVMQLASGIQAYTAPTRSSSYSAWDLPVENTSRLSAANLSFHSCPNLFSAACSLSS